MLKQFLFISCLYSSLFIASDCRKIKREDIFDFEVCPESHPFAFKQGQQCCKTRSNATEATWSLQTCDDESVNCPASRCEDLPQACNLCKICGKFNYFQIKKISPEYDGTYNFDYDQGFLEANRPVYQKLLTNDKCVWWHQQYRHWWVGPCENVGTNSGFAYLEQDFTCPISRNGDQMIWRRGGSDDVIPDVETFISISMDRVAGAKQQVRLSGTAGVNAIIRNGRYRQECRFVYRNGQFKCEKP